MYNESFYPFLALSDCFNILRAILSIVQEIDSVDMRTAQARANVTNYSAFDFHKKTFFSIKGWITLI